MKLIKYIGFGLFAVAGFSSCSDWLDVNDNPNSPTNTVAAVAARLPWIQHHYGYAHGVASFRGSFITGQVTSRSGYASTSAYEYMSIWAPAQGMATTPYQHWFVGAGCNIDDLITKAKEEGAYHYIGAAKVLHAMGFMLMADWYGECPYTEALGPVLNPKYDDGKTIFYGCLNELDEALSYFGMTQDVGATPLAKGDNWNGGDLSKWVALVHGLKARWLNNLSKKSFYDPQAILAEINLGPTSNALSTVINHENDPADLTGDVLTGDPLKTSFIFDSGAWSDHIRATKFYTDMFEYEQPDGTMLYDPRREKMLPANQHWNADGTSYFMVTKGADVIHSDLKLLNGPQIQSYDTKTRTYKCSTPARAADTVYVTFKGVCSMQGATSGDGTYFAADGTILSTGSFYTRPESPSHYMTYYEMCFIKAEVLFRQGDKAGALAAYKAGIKSHFEMMNDKLNEYEGTTNPGKMPMDETEISNFLNSDAICQNAASLTMAEIMKQKYIAMSFSQQNWNDMRRFNYSAGNIGDFGVVYPNFDRPRAMPVDATATIMPGASKTDDNYWWRRSMHCSHETNYNLKQLEASNPKALSKDIWSVPVWWDTVE